MMRSLPTSLRPYLFAIAAMALISLPQFAAAQDASAEGKPTTALTREEAKDASDKANAQKGVIPAKENPGAKSDETHAKDALTPGAIKPEKALSPAEKTAAINAADEISKFDADKVIGMARPWQVYYQPAATPIMDAVEPVHDYVLVVITIVTLFVLVLLFIVITRFSKKKNPKPATFTHNKTIEVIWTVIPILILVSIAIPSLRLHYNYYNNEETMSNADLNIKVVGRQWYWSYEYPDQGIAFDSNIKPEKDLKNGEPRLLAVDNPIVVPVNKVVRIQITGADVMHAWAVPSFGIKKGAIPGRLNETWFKAEKEGIYFGQCSILCGKSHGFMPIEVVVVSQEKFDAWVKGAKLKFAANDLMQFAALN